MMNSDQPQIDFGVPPEDSDWLPSDPGCGLVVYVFIGLIVGGITKLIGANLFGAGSMIGDPVERARIDRLEWIAVCGWVIGGIGLVYGRWVKKNKLESRPIERRRVSLGTLGLAVLWLLFSIWVIRESNQAVHRTNPARTYVGDWYVSSPSGPGSGRSIYLRDEGVDPANLTIPADVPVLVSVLNFGTVPHTLAFEGIDTDTPPVLPGTETSIKVTVQAPPGDYTYRCTSPGHESESGGTLHVVPTKVVAEITYNGERLVSEDLSIPAGQLVAIRIHNASETPGDDVRIEFAGLSGDQTGTQVRFMVNQGQTTDLVMTVPAGEWLFWGTSRKQLTKEALDDKAEGDIPGDTLVAE